MHESIPNRSPQPHIADSASNAHHARAVDAPARHVDHDKASPHSSERKRRSRQEIPDVQLEATLHDLDIWLGAIRSNTPSREDQIVNLRNSIIDVSPILAQVLSRVCAYFGPKSAQAAITRALWKDAHSIRSRWAEMTPTEQQDRISHLHQEAQALLSIFNAD